MMEKPLVKLRDDLRTLGLGRLPESTLVEDHVSALFETMRRLIEGGDDLRPASLDTQRGFFEVHVLPWVMACCDAIKSNPLANFYVRVAEFTELFMAIERDSFAIG